MNKEKKNIINDSWLRKMEDEARELKRQGEIHALNVVKSMCYESLCPETGEEWDRVYSELCETRKIPKTNTTNFLSLP